MGHFSKPRVAVQIFDRDRDVAVAVDRDTKTAIKSVKKTIGYYLMVLTFIKFYKDLIKKVKVVP